MKEIIEKYKIHFKETISDLKTPGKRYRQIPNILTGSRLLSPFVILPSVLTGNFVLAGISTSLFAITDLFDGFVARKFNITSEFGKDLDAFTDKIFVGTLMLSLVFTNPFYIFPIILESTIAGININKKIKNQNPESHMIGKIKMASLYVLITLGFLNMYCKVSQSLLNSLFISTIGLQGLTIADYSKKINNKVEETPNKEVKEVQESIDSQDEEKEKTITQKYLKQYKQYKALLEEQQKMESISKNMDNPNDAKINIKIKNKNSI